MKLDDVLWLAACARRVWLLKKKEFPMLDGADLSVICMQVNIPCVGPATRSGR